ncbi:TetR/AcrR family transcriptional regulator [Ketobacter sp.]|uniref:TetR/AcrR family transcriptional regulator n=1 Tax=Ketobacter sp. TaxID=2083498 RepID=UPI000F23B88F|nr:TetR/AcrR family transcriptional regulator [Ketobacter sp.]RLU00958.1 MAG: TetR/AcrR family transcriptional regulator [Ketobacter sp.]
MRRKISQRRKPKQARAVQKYNEILDAAARVLVLLDYGDTTMSEIHLESGHPYATIYQYFGNKEDIYLAWIERFMDAAIFELTDRIRRTDSRDFESRLEISVRYSLEQIASERQVLGKLLNGMALVSSRMVEHLEEKTRHWILQAFGPKLQLPRHREPLEKMLTAARATNGYWLMLMLNTQQEIHIQEETRRVSSLIKALLA